MTAFRASLFSFGHRTAFGAFAAASLWTTVAGAQALRPAPGEPDYTSVAVGFDEGERPLLVCGAGQRTFYVRSHEGRFFVHIDSRAETQPASAGARSEATVRSAWIEMGIRRHSNGHCVAELFSHDPSIGAATFDFAAQRLYPRSSYQEGRYQSYWTCSVAQSRADFLAKGQTCAPEGRSSGVPIVQQSTDPCASHQGRLALASRFLQARGMNPYCYGDPSCIWMSAIKAVCSEGSRPGSTRPTPMPVSPGWPRLAI